MYITAMYNFFTQKEWSTEAKLPVRKNT